MKELHIGPLAKNQRAPFELLEMADPSRLRIESYLKTGNCYIAQINSRVLGVMILNKIDSTTIEIMNIAIQESEQRKGFGKALLRYSEKISQESGFKKIIIGTGNSSIGQLDLYQKEGFEVDRIEEDFYIKNYSEPIFENGIQCKHRIVLIKKLNN